MRLSLPERLPQPLPLAPRIFDPRKIEMIALGKKLFSDPRLSRDNSISCASCHDPDRSFVDGRRFAVGIAEQQGLRNSPTIIDSAHRKSFFWDGRARTLEEQALIPIQDPREMGMTLKALEHKINADKEYSRTFEKLFKGSATSSRIADAIAAFERSVVSRGTAFDDYLRGDRNALSPEALRGMNLFFGEANCATCHTGSHLSDGEFHNIGAIDSDLLPDPGRKKISGRPSDYGAFKTPSLRGVSSTGPYMHNGMFQTLKEVVTHYNFGGVRDEANDYRDERLEVLYLSEEQVRDLVSFLVEGLDESDVAD